MRAINEEERGFIQQKLLFKGRDIFAQFGIKKTTIRQLSRAAGISSGSFYMYFESKEELFFQILTLEINNTINGNMEIMSSHSYEPGIMIKMIIKKAVSNFEQNPILKILLIREEFELLHQKFSSRSKEMRDILINLVSKWNEMGILISEDSDVLAGAIRALLFMTFHKEEIGINNFERSMELLIDFTAKGIVKESKEESL